MTSYWSRKIYTIVNHKDHSDLEDVKVALPYLKDAHRLIAVIADKNLDFLG